MNFPGRHLARFSWCFWLLAMAVDNAGAQSIDFSGEVAVQSLFQMDHPRQAQIGLRYIPSLDGNRKISRRGSVGVSVSANLFEGLRFRTGTPAANNHAFGWYRYWVRFATPNLEIRLGNQKISFGPAKLFRSLMWFDRLDQQDPLQLTNGVKAMLIRYYFPNNTNIWLWGLAGNPGRKGIELFPTTGKKPEFGGRIQIPFWTGQVGLTGHHRWAESTDLSLRAPGQSSLINFQENRLALDGSWDVGVGLWMESALFHYQSQYAPFQWRQMATLGADYTIPIGNGVYVLEENLMHAFSKTASHLANRRMFSGILLTYPLNIVDQMMVFSTYDWQSRNFFHFVRWQRSTDRWQFNLSAFLIPNDTADWGNPALSTLRGKGFEVLVVYNY